MTRQFLIVAIVGLLAAPLAAEDQLIQFADQDDSAPAPLVIPDPGQSWDLGWQVDRIAAATSSSAGDAAAVPDDAKATSASGRSFRPVCECCCKIQPLDRWCVCGTTCCTTECWTPYPCKCSQGNCYLSDDGGWVTNDARCDVWGTDICPTNAAVRFGWWGVTTSGSQVKTGEFQDLESSPFWNVDAISSDGTRTWDISLSGLDNEANDARFRYYGPLMRADVEFERYLRRLDHKPLAGFNLNGPVAPGADDNVVVDDLNMGEEYAIRVQELDARFRGQLTKNLKWKLDVWTQRKFGTRQANAPAHCFEMGGAAGNTCHVVSQQQSIDWMTVEVKPVLEAHFENATVEYSRTMRSFGQGDDIVTRQYTHFNGFSPANDVLGPPYAYGLVSENFTQTDRVKADVQLNCDNRLYANTYVGNTENNFRETHRDFYGYDLRLINSSFDGMSLTGYASMYTEKNQVPTDYLTTLPYAPDNTYDEDSLRHPVDYSRSRAGIKGSWRPWGNLSYCSSYGLRYGTSLTAGYEYYRLDRDYAQYPTPDGTFYQDDTIRHEIKVGPATRWNRCLDTYVRYRVRFTENPLIGVSEYSDEDPDVQATFNSSQPDQEHGVEIGGTWAPLSNFMTSAQLCIINSWQYSEYARFSETSYPLYLTCWWAPTNRLSLTGAYMYYSDWIDQDITLGANRGDPADTERTNWNYSGENHLISFNANYAWSDCLQLVGGVEWDRGRNVFNVPTSPHAADGVDWSLLPYLSDVVVDTQRITVGADWQAWQHMGTYFRYIYYNYDDMSAAYNSGQAHMFLAGVTLTQ